MPSKQEILTLIWNNPIEVGHWVGLKDLNQLNNLWLRNMLFRTDDYNMQAHRGSYKTTTLSLFFALHIVLRPNETLLYFRKTSTDVWEIARQTKNILESGCMKEIGRILYGKPYTITVDTKSEISTDLPTKITGAPQLAGLGIGSSITGKHADIVVTDDIVNLKDRASEAERNRVKLAYQELQNIKNRDGRFINCGTPWHVDDAFSMMKNIHRYDCYSTGMMDETKIKELKERMTASLFAANYELKHISDADLLFCEPEKDADINHIYNALGHVDAAFGGEDGTAFTLMKKEGNKYYVFGKLWHKHVEACYEEIKKHYNELQCKKIYNETNADKGFVIKEMRGLKITMKPYHEEMNKYIKISTYLKSIWKDVIFVAGTDDEYISQITNYNQDAEHDDAPDSCACLAREFVKKERKIGTIDKKMLGL